MKLTNNLLLSALAACSLMLTGCATEEADYTPGQPYNGTPQVFFAEQEDNIIFNLDDETKATVTVSRENADEAQTVALKCTTVTPQCFTSLPQSVTFEAGQAEAGITVELDKDAMQLARTYDLTIDIDGNYFDAYTWQDVSSRLHVFFTREDYEPWADGTYGSYFWGEEWPATLEYSETLGLYRLKALWSDSSDPVLFSLNADNTLTFAASSFVTGLSDETYGPVTAVVATSADADYFPSWLTVDEETGEEVFEFCYKWNVSAGSFGIYPEYFIVESKY